MPLSEQHEILLHELLDVNERVCAALDAGSFDALEELAQENRRITTALAAEPLPARSDPEARVRLIEVVGLIRETRSRLEQRRDGLAEQLHTMNTKQKIHRAYSSRR
jgi:hypothetical protein